MDVAGGAAAVPDKVRRGKLNELLGVPTPGQEGTGGTEAEGAGGTDPAHPVDPAQVQPRPYLLIPVLALRNASSTANRGISDHVRFQHHSGPRAWGPIL